MKIFHAAFAALLITGSMFLPPAHAQSTPQRSYPTSCTDARVEDRTVCRFADGREQRTSLTDVNGCVNDIGNDNGALTCNHGQPMAPYREDRRQERFFLARRRNGAVWIARRANRKGPLICSPSYNSTPSIDSPKIFSRSAMTP